MRQIKFRGRRLNDKSWVYGSLSIFPDGNTSIRGLKSWDESVWVDSETVGQFIDLRDRNDKEIYEGDIVKYSIEGDSQDNPLVVDELNLHLGLNESDHYLRIDEGSLEVIGNIYENPKLLK